MDVVVTDCVFDGGREMLLVLFVDDGCFTSVYSHWYALRTYNVCFTFVVEW